MREFCEFVGRCVSVSALYVILCKSFIFVFVIVFIFFSLSLCFIGLIDDVKEWFYAIFNVLCEIICFFVKSSFRHVKIMFFLDSFFVKISYP